MSPTPPRKPYTFGEKQWAGYVAELESMLRNYERWVIKDFQVRTVEDAPRVEIVFIDQRVPKIRFGYRSHIWDSDPVVWWANFMENTDAVMAWRNVSDAPAEVIWLR